MYQKKNQRKRPKKSCFDFNVNASAEQQQDRHRLLSSPLLSSLSLPTVTQATADNRLARGTGGGWQLYRTHSLRLLRLSVRPTVAHTRSRLCHATVLWGAARMASSNWLQQATVQEQLLPHPFAKYERHQQRRVDAAASHNTPPPQPQYSASATPRCLDS